MMDLKRANEILRINDSRPVVFVYTAPKVGSTSIVSSLRIFAHKIMHVIHIHDNKMLEVLSGIKDVTINDIIKYNGELGRPTYVIDVYRNPIEHKISYFFELLSYHFNNNLAEIGTYSVKRLTERFNQIFPYINVESKFCNAYGIPQEHIPPVFNGSAGFLLIEVNKVKYISLRLADSGRWGTILSQLLGITPFHMVSEYKTENKSNIGKLYTSFVSNYLIPQNIFQDNVRDNKDAKYFLSNSEYVAYIEKWTGRTGPSITYFNVDQYAAYENISMANCQFNNQIFVNHYTDEGCGCKACGVKRGQIIHKIVSSTYNGELNHHTNSKNEFFAQKICMRAKYKTAEMARVRSSQNKPVGQIMAGILR